MIETIYRCDRCGFQFNKEPDSVRQLWNVTLSYQLMDSTVPYTVEKWKEEQWCRDCLIHYGAFQNYRASSDKRSSATLDELVKIMTNKIIGEEDV